MSKIRFFFFFLFFIPFLLPAAIYGATADGFLTLTDQENKTLLLIPVKNNQFFYIAYKHSVAQSLVRDYFRITANNIVLDRTEYRDFGAGLPHMPEEGQKMVVEQGKIILGGYNRLLPEFALRVGRVAHHTLVLLYPGDEKEAHAPLLNLPLDYLARPGSAVTFKILADS